MKKLLYITSFAMLFLFGTNSLLMAQQKKQQGAVFAFEKSVKILVPCMLMS